MPDVVTQAVDPVCGMLIDRDDAIVVTYAGAPYYFCEAACADIFRDEPERWAQGPGHGPMTHDHGG